MSRALQKATAKLEAGNDPFLASPLVAVLAEPPGSRDDEQSQLALDWWLQQLPTVGRRLSVELQGPENALLTAFQRGRLLVCAKGQVVQQEGEEVRSYTIVLVGSCRMRCRIPAPKSGGAPVAARSGKGESAGGDGDDAAADQAAEELSSTTVDVARGGDSPGIYPGESRSSYEVSCPERSLLLQLNAEDYGATFQRYHRSLQAAALDFLRSHAVCPGATSSQLQRLAGMLRPRTYRRGHILMTAGESSRHVWILREGTLSALATGADEALELAKLARREEVSAGGEGQSAEDQDPEEEKEEELEKRREKLLGLKQVSAYKEDQNIAVSKYARGAIKGLLRPAGAEPEKKGGALFGGKEAAKAGAPMATYCQPGTLLGEEALLFDGFREQLSAKVLNTVRVEAESSFYVADITAFRLLIQCVGQEQLAEKVGEKVGRRGAQLGRSAVASKQLERTKKHLQKRESARQERQQVRLPPSSGVPGGIMELDDVNDWLKVVLEHRRPPPNDKNPSSLCLLDGLGVNPFTQCGPAVESMRKTYSSPELLKEHQMAMSRLKRGGGRWRAPAQSSNPMGDTVSAQARYEETAPPAPLETHVVAPSVSEPGAPSIFFQTEPELEDLSQEQAMLAKSSSVPVLPRLKAGGEDELEERSTVFDSKKMSSFLEGTTQSSATGLGDFKSSSQKQAQRIMKAFHRVIKGKNVLILTDKTDVRRSIMRAMMCAAEEMNLCFVRTTAELLKRMREAKEQYHALIVDLSKTELEVEGLVRTVRGHDRYGQLPMVVLANERELPDLVRQSCSFVVFFPLSATMLREALLWCFDRKSLQARSYADPSKSIFSSKSTMESPTKVSGLSIVARPMEVH